MSQSTGSRPGQARDIPSTDALERLRDDRAALCRLHRAIHAFNAHVEEQIDEALVSARRRKLLSLKHIIEIFNYLLHRYVQGSESLSIDASASKRPCSLVIDADLAIALKYLDPAAWIERIPLLQETVEALRRYEGEIRYERNIDWVAIAKLNPSVWATETIEALQAIGEEKSAKIQRRLTAEATDPNSEKNLLVKAAEQACSLLEPLRELEDRLVDRITPLLTNNDNGQQHIGEEHVGINSASIGTAVEGKPPANDDAEVEPLEGPIEPDGFNYGGNTFKGLRNHAFRALQFLWNRRNKAAKTIDLAGPVWDDHAQPVDENGVGGLRRDINKFFRTHDIPYHAEVKNGCLSVCDGPPRPSKKASKRRRAATKPRKRSR